VPKNNIPTLPFPGEFKAPDPRKLLGLGLIGLIIIGVFSSFYQVPANSEGVVQRFGAFVTTTKPGLHFKLPFGIDKVTVVEKERQQKLEFGFGTGGGTNPYQYSESRNAQELERNMVTGDLNAAMIEWAVQYQISDSYNYVFNFRDPAKTLRDLAEAVMREVVGDRTVDEVLTIGRTEMETNALTRMRELVSALHMGVSIEQIQLRQVGPPAQVRSSFDEVNRAKQEKEQLINQADGEYNKVIPKASGEAEQKIAAAEGYAQKRVNEAEGDAARFNALLAEYKKAPEVTKKRLYLETMTGVLANTPGKVIIDEKAPQFLPMMPLRQSQTMNQVPNAQ
jgi:membrane protease subunit HflK